MKGKLLPQKLKELRQVNNYTQDYVAAVLGVVRQTYSHMKPVNVHQMQKHYINWRVYTIFRLTISCI